MPTLPRMAAFNSLMGLAALSTEKLPLNESRFKSIRPTASPRTARELLSSKLAKTWARDK